MPLSGAPPPGDRRATLPRLLAVLLAALRPAPAGGVPCISGEPVLAYFAGQVDVGSPQGVVACIPEMEQCYFPGRIHSGPDADGNYVLNWDDGELGQKLKKNKLDKDRSKHLITMADDLETSQLEGKKMLKRKADVKDAKQANKKMKGQIEKLKEAIKTARKLVVHFEHVRVSTTSQPCDGPNEPPEDEEESWVPPEIPCTVLPRLHWEGSDPDWNREAVDALKAEHRPDEVIDGFDWHVILRFHDVDACEAAFTSLEGALKLCRDDDPEKCRTHKYVKAVEYVGDDPDTRRRTGRQFHSHDRPPPQSRSEL